MFFTPLTFLGMMVVTSSQNVEHVLNVDFKLKFPEVFSNVLNVALKLNIQANSPVLKTRGRYAGLTSIHLKKKKRCIKYASAKKHRPICLRII